MNELTSREIQLITALCPFDLSLLDSLDDEQKEAIIKCQSILLENGEEKRTPEDMYVENQLVTVVTRVVLIEYFIIGFPFKLEIESKYKYEPRTNINKCISDFGKKESVVSLILKI